MVLDICCDAMCWTSWIDVRGQIMDTTGIRRSVRQCETSATYVDYRFEEFA